MSPLRGGSTILTVQFGAQMESGKKQDLPFQIVHRQGRNARQSNVTLEAADAAPPHP